LKEDEVISKMETTTKIQCSHHFRKFTKMVTAFFRMFQHRESSNRGSGVLSLLRYESGKPMTVLSAGCRRKVTEDEPLTPYDRIAQTPAEHR